MSSREDIRLRLVSLAVQEALFRVSEYIFIFIFLNALCENQLLKYTFFLYQREQNLPLNEALVQQEEELLQNEAAAVIIGEPLRQHPALNFIGGFPELDLDILSDDIDEGLGEDGGIQEERSSSQKVDVLSAPYIRFCAAVSKVRIMTLDGVRNLCTSCYIMYIYRITAGWHQHIDQHIQGRLRDIPRDRCYACGKMLAQLRLTSVCYMCNTVK